MSTDRLLEQFFSYASPSLKICGITRAQDAFDLCEHGVTGIGINFWPQSKRYCSPSEALTFAPQIQGKILRVGVFVNATEAEVLTCFENNLIDVAQFHGDESPAFLQQFQNHNFPFIRAIGITEHGELPEISRIPTPYLLLDAHAPGVYGGTGKTIDWDFAKTFINEHPEHSVMLAGGITPKNAKAAADLVKPCALDLASGAESSPGIKDFDKVKAIQKELS